MIPRQIESSNVIAEPPLHSGLGAASGAPWRLKCLPGWWSSDRPTPLRKGVKKGITRFGDHQTPCEGENPLKRQGTVPLECKWQSAIWSKHWILSLWRLVKSDSLLQSLRTGEEWALPSISSLDGRPFGFAPQQRGRMRYDAIDIRDGVFRTFFAAEVNVRCQEANTCPFPKKNTI